MTWGVKGRQDYFPTNFPITPTLGEPHCKKNRVYLGIAQKAIWPPLLRTFGHFVAQVFRRKLENSLNSNFDFGNEYFDID